MPTTFPAVAIDQQSTKKVDADVVEVIMGKGYIQRVPNGINYRRDFINIVWSGLNASDYATVISFLDSVSGGDYFTWTSPFDSSSKKYILEGGRTIASNGGNIYTVSQQVKQVYL